MKLTSLMITMAVVQVIGVVALVFALVAGVNVVKESGGLKSVIESVWCGNDGCDGK